MAKNATDLQSIQIMRGIASVLVVMTHIAVKGQQYGNDALKEYNIGGAGVDLFFIISGYIMCISTYDQHTNFTQFIIRRIKRIIPLYWLITTLALIIYLYNAKLINSSGGATSVWASYTLIPNGKKLLNQNGWTLTYEFFFYAIFGLALSKGTLKAMQLSSCIILSLVAIGLFVNFTRPADTIITNTQPLFATFPSRQPLFATFTNIQPLLATFTNSFLIEFVFGMGCFYLFNIKKVRLNYISSIGLIMLGLLLFPLQNLLGIPDDAKWRGMTWGTKMLPIFIGLLALEDRIRRSSFPLKGLSLELGNSSYSLYLTHPFALSGTAICLKHLGLTTNPWSFTIILGVTAVAIGHLVYLYVEKPLTSLTKKFVIAL